MVRRWSWLPFCSLFLALAAAVAFEVPISDTDYDRQICSGMWGGKNAYINVTFDSGSLGQLAMVIYEWSDVKYLGKDATTGRPVSAYEVSAARPLNPRYMTQEKYYVCTSDALRGGYCESSQLGRFIVDLPSGQSINDTSIWSARVALPTGSDSATEGSNVAVSGLWDNPDGNPTPPDLGPEYETNWRRDSVLAVRQAVNPSPTSILRYQSAIQYNVRKTGYYCVAIVPITVLPATSARQDVSNNPHPSYSGSVFFRNTFDGRLPASDYPKVNFYFSMFLVYSALAIVWGWLCYQNVQDLLPIQYYVSGLLGFLIIEMLANWAYYRYLNAHGEGTPSTVFLIVVAILDAGRNALSFFLLLVVSLGLSVVKESLGRTMLKCQLLAGAHFVFGVLYAVGIVELELESASAFILLLFVIPLAFTLSGFLLWIIYSLNAMFDEIAQDEEDAEDYDLESLEHRTDARGLHETDDDAATLVGRPVGDDAVVFEIGDEDGAGSDDEDAPKKRRGERERLDGAEHEREGLMKDD
ncbi:hypothetical protein TRAPUB_13361 [Trametes pubescens]|uniref:Membrane protein PTM1 n=1 Tax=Trametes pubescens TaxID=154538 RepID=A0A1M2W7V3_TRAPU|nr:hypothetical protein TRAPUB_13361 [Trametes pubescens]